MTLLHGSLLRASFPYVSTLEKGSYRVTVSYLNEQLREERFTLY
jgi:hypothetical protein